MAKQNKTKSGVKSPMEIPGSRMDGGLLRDRNNNIWTRDTSTNRYYNTIPSLDILRNPARFTKDQQIINRDIVKPILDKQYDERQGFVKKPDAYNIPEMNLGGWVKDNKQGVMGGLTTAAGIGAMFVPGLQGLGAGLISSGVGGIAGEIKQDAAAEQAVQAQAKAQGAQPSTPSTSTFKKGGVYRKMANGGLVEWQGGEPRMTPGGKIIRTPKSAPSHKEGGVTGFVEEGTGFLGTKKNPETGKTYMEEGDKLGKIQNKADKKLQTTSNKYAKNSALLNKETAKRKYQGLLEQQESRKRGKGVVKAETGFDGQFPPTIDRLPLETQDFTKSIPQDIIDPMAAGQGTGVINSPGTSGGGFSNFMGQNGAALASLAPVAFDAISAMSKPDEEYLPHQYGSANALLANRRFNIRPMLRRNRITQQIGDYNAKARGAGSMYGQRQVNMAGRMGADMQAEATRQQMDNQYRAEQAQGLFGTGQAQRGVDVANLQNQAARRNLLRSSVGGFSNYMQNRELMNNMLKRDQQRSEILPRMYPHYNKQFGDIDLNLYDRYGSK